MGDGGPATDARLVDPNGVVFDRTGNLYIAETGRIRKVSRDGIITTIAGTGLQGDGGDGGPAVNAQVKIPWGVALDTQGNLYFSDTQAHRVRRIDTTGIITTVAGTGVAGFSGDGGPAPSAQLANPRGIALDGQGNLYIADTTNNRIRRVDVNGVITTVAGNGTLGGFPSDGSGLPATQVGLWSPRDVTLDQYGNLYISDTGNDLIRKVSPGGILTTIVGQLRSTRGGGPGSFNGDGLLGLQTLIGNVEGLAVDGEGNLFFVNPQNRRVRVLSADGVVTTVAGNGTLGFSGDGGAPTRAAIAATGGVAFSPDGDLYFAESFNDRVRRVRSVLPGFAGLADIVIASQDGSEVYVFSPQGRHLRTVNPLTNALVYEFTYDSNGFLTAVTDRDSNVTTIERDANGNVTGIVSPFGQQTIVTLDANGYMTSITNPAGETTAFSYTEDGLLTGLTSPRGDSSAFQYDSNGRLIGTLNPAGGSDTLARTSIANGYVVTHTTAENRQTSYQVEFLPTGEQRRVNTLPDGTQKEVLIGTDGSRLTTATDGMRQELIEGPDPRFGMQAPLNQDFTLTTPDGLAATLTGSRTVSLADSSNPLSLTSQTDSFSLNGRTFLSTYDTASRTVTDTTPDGQQRTTTLNAQGRVVRQQVGNLAPTQLAYDSRGRLSTVMQGTRTSTLGYNTQGNLASITDPLSRTLNFEYDAAGRVTQQTLPDGRVIHFTYDASGNVTSITPPGRPAHTFTYTPGNLEKEYLPPNSQPPTPDPRTLFTYNADRQLTRITRPDGQAVVFDYDPAGRLSTQALPHGQIHFTYDPATGNRRTITTPDGGAIAFSYDGALVTDTTWTGAISGSVSNTYDSDFRVVTQSVNGGHPVSLVYDANNQLIGAGDLVLTRDSQNGLVTGGTLGSVTDTIGYNGFGEPMGYTATANGATLFDVQYIRDELGRVTQKSETISGVTTTFDYIYDLAGRLTAVKQNGTTTAMYEYDSNSNRLSVTTSGGTVTGTYDNQDRLLSYGGATYTYTANGELQSKTVGSNTTTYTYDVLGNLLAVTLPDGTQLEYIIDGESRRIGKQVEGVLVQGFVYQDQLNPVAELDGSGNIVARFVYGSKQNIPDYLVKAGVSYRIISDHLGSPRLVIDTTTGVIVQRLDYDEFGNIIFDTNPGFQPFGYASGIYDPDTKLTRFGARDYDAEAGRWTAKDPIRFEGKDTNLYGYVLNDPINTIDPNGKQSSLASLAGAFVAGRILSAAFGAAANVGLLFGAKLAKCDFEFDLEEIGDTAAEGALAGVVFPPVRLTAVFVLDLGASPTLAFIAGFAGAGFYNLFKYSDQAVCQPEL